MTGENPLPRRSVRLTGPLAEPAAPPAALAGPPPSRRIGEILIAAGLIDENTLAQALEIQVLERSRNIRRLGEILVDEFGIDRDRINREFARYYGFREASLPDPLVRETIAASRQILDGLARADREQLLDFKAAPLAGPAGSLRFVSPVPADPQLGDLIHRLGFDGSEVVFCSSHDFERLVHEIAPPANEFLEMFKEASQTELAVSDEQAEEEARLIDEQSHQSVLTNLVEGALIEAVHQGASDIHVIPRAGNAVEFHLRVDGRLRLWHRQENVKPEAVSAIIKDRSQKIDRFDWDSAQDGFIQRRVDSHLIRYRVSILPLVATEFHRKFESLVIRVLDDRKVITDLDRLGFQKQAREDFQRAVGVPQGLIILTGPTGSGKSTTLVAALHHVMSPEVNVLTVEDPVEYHIAGARQIKLGPRLDFDQALRSILRHDPDIVMLGEIRDHKTAEIAIKLANTGHLTLTTLHTNDAPSAISRLFKMGVEPFLLANALNIVVAQRLVRRLCPNCKALAGNPDTVLAARLGFTPQEIEHGRFYRPVGCELCRTGYQGRIGIHETLVFSRRIRRMVLDAAESIDEDAIREEAIRSGMLTLRASGRLRVLDGTTSLEEIALSTMEG